MKALLSLTLLVSMGAAYTPVCQQFRVTNFGTPIHSATWQEIKSASTITKVCMVAAWGGTAVLFGTAPAWRNPTVRTIATIAGGVAITSLLIGMATAH